jgi:hypothetical protein
VTADGRALTDGTGAVTDGFDGELECDAAGDRLAEDPAFDDGEPPHPTSTASAQMDAATGNVETFLIERVKPVLPLVLINAGYRRNRPFEPRVARGRSAP